MQGFRTGLTRSLKKYADASGMLDKLTNLPAYFERNRFFIGGGYEINDQLSFQSGYVHQFDYKIDDETGRDFFQISLLLNFNLKKDKQEFLPSVSD